MARAKARAAARRSSTSAGVWLERSGLQDLSAGSPLLATEALSVVRARRLSALSPAVVECTHSEHEAVRVAASRLGNVEAGRLSLAGSAELSGAVDIAGEAVARVGELSLADGADTGAGPKQEEHASRASSREPGPSG